MRKIQIYVSALLVLGGSFVTTSCVDDNESSSVKEVREAYANQLKAQAELAKAQIEADKIRAEAEALLVQAQVDHVKSQTKLNEANAALLAAQTDIEKAKAEADKLVAELELKALQEKVKFDLEEYKYKLEQVQIVAEIEMLKLQAELDNAKNEKDLVLERAINDYKVYIGEVNQLKKNLAQAELNLTYDKAVLSDLKLTKVADNEASIKLYNEWIINMESQIDNNTKQIDNWNKILTNIDAKAIESEIAEKTKEYQTLLLAQTSLKKDYNLIRLTFENGVNKDLLIFQSLVGKDYTSKPMPYNRTYYTLLEIEATIKTLSDNIPAYGTQIESKKKELDNLKSKSDGLLSARNKSYDESQRLYQIYQEMDYWNGNWNNWNDFDRAREKAYQAYRDAENIYSNARAQYNNNQSNIYSVESDISNLNYSLTRDIANLERANTRKDAYEGDAKKGEKLIATYLVAEKEYDAAYKAYVENAQEVESLSEYLQELKRVYYTGDLVYPTGGAWASSITLDQVKAHIETLKTRNTESEAKVAQYKRDIANVKELNKLAIEQLDQNIKDAEVEIARMKTLLPIAEKQAQEAKVIVDARMK